MANTFQWLPRQTTRFYIVWKTQIRATQVVLASPSGLTSYYHDSIEEPVAAHHPQLRSGIVFKVL